MEFTDCRADAHIVERTSSGDSHRAVIAVNDDVGQGPVCHLRHMDLHGYRRNPVVLFQHDHTMPVGRTTDIRFDERERLVAQFEFLPNDTNADRVRNAWEQGFLNAASIGFRTLPRAAGELRERQVLKEWSIVAIPADEDALRSAGLGALLNRLASSIGDTTMDEQAIQRIIQRELTARGDASSDRLAGDIARTLATDMATAVSEAVRQQVADAFAERDRAQEAALEAQRREQEAVQTANRRAELIITARDLLPDSEDLTQLTDRQILERAVGSEVDRVADRDESYLRGVVDSIARRRRAAGDAYSAGAQTSPSTNGDARNARLADILNLPEREWRGTEAIDPDDVRAMNPLAMRGITRNRGQ